MDKVRCIALDYGGTLDDRTVARDCDGNYPVDLSCIPPLREIHGLGVTLVLSTNTEPRQHRRAALDRAGISGLFRAVLASDCLGLGKPDPGFYAMIPAVAGCGFEEVLHVGDKLVPDVLGPVNCGMQAALIRPAGGLTPGDFAKLPRGTLLIDHIRELMRLFAGSGS